MNKYISETVERWTQDGKQMIQSECEAGRANGWLILLHDNGDKMFQGEWHNGVPHGLTQSWYPNGEPMHEIQFENGYLHGNWKMWSETGELLVTAFYEFGIKTEWIEWDQDGQVKYEWKAKHF
ncbi:MAG: toxin-antitoxin system YwqK family antitoxin [Bdellovibrionia bacterium]